MRNRRHQVHKKYGVVDSSSYFVTPFHIIYLSTSYCRAFWVDTIFCFRMFQQFPGSVPFGAPVVHEWVQQRRENIRPWSTFFNTSNIRKPPSLTRLTKRVLANVEYFKSNYLFVYIGLVLYCL